MTPRKRGRPRGNERITYREAASILGVTETTVTRWVKDGYLPAYQTDGGYHKLWRTVVAELRDDRKSAESRESVDIVDGVGIGSSCTAKRDEREGRF